MKIENLDAAACRTLRSEGLEAINKALEPFGVAATISGTMNFTGERIGAKFEFVHSDGDATQALRASAERDFRIAARNFGLQPDDFGKPLVLRGTMYRVAGLAGRRSSKITIERQHDGKQFVASADVVRSALALLARKDTFTPAQA